MGVVVDDPPVLANEGWFNNRWRPAMAWLWFSVSACDFILFPVLNAAAAGAKLIPYAPWSPITLQGGGLFHVAMGAVVGVAVWQRTQEKLAIFNNPLTGGSAVSQSTTTTTSSSVQQRDPNPPAITQSSRAD